MLTVLQLNKINLTRLRGDQLFRLQSLYKYLLSQESLFWAVKDPTNLRGYFQKRMRRDVFIICPPPGREIEKLTFDVFD